ncbi:hypothetical protein CRUP_030403 [Coryphaenoides rupestris]|nr:hypothetical protein CRUP_030403 [Coryphaenoides rupestris]
MGAVHAKSLDPLPMHGRDLGVNPDDMIELPEPVQEAKQEILENKDVVVQHVNIQGLGRTKEDLLGYEIAEVFHAKNLIDVRAEALPNGLDVVFEVTEVKRLTGSYNTMVGNNEGSMVLGLKLPNMFGRAEKLTFQFSYGTKETSYGLAFFKPQPGCFERNLVLNLYKFPVGRSSHSVKWEGVWRELGCLARSASFAVREESGHSLKSALSELAGYTGGDASFLKEDFELQVNKHLFLDSVLSASLWGGMLYPLGGQTSSIADRFYLGGPTSVRGFGMYSIGPQSEGDYLGGEAYWAGGLHLYTPLPFRPGKGGFGDLFRTHFFLNAGNLCNLNYGEGPRAHLQKLAECLRWSYGAGVVLRLGNIARLELNYCVPMGVQSGDRICDGVQFGAGIRFL